MAFSAAGLQTSYAKASYSLARHHNCAHNFDEPSSFWMIGGARIRNYEESLCWHGPDQVKSRHPHLNFLDGLHVAHISHGCFPPSSRMTHNVASSPSFPSITGKG